jgi:N-acetylneuraminic acid mutarotase
VTYTGAATVAKYAQTVTLYNDAFYVIGGYTGSTYVTTTQMFTISTSTWTDLTSTGFTARAAHTANLYNGKVYIIGGMTSGTTYTSTVYAYTISSNTWAAITADGDTFTARAYHTATLLNDAIYVIGGRPTPSTYLSDVMKFDIVTSTWTTLTTMDNVLGHHTATLYNNLIYVICGETSPDPTYLSKVFTYNVATNTITTIAYSGMISPRSGHAAVLYNNIIYVIAGEDSGGRRSDIVKFVHDAPGILLLLPLPSILMLPLPLLILILILPL